MPLFKKYESAPAAYASWKNNTHPQWWKDPGLRLNMAFVTCLYLGIFISGYDGALLNGLQAMSTWTKYFNSPAGNRLGLISASLYLPTFLATPFIPWACDKFSRRPVIIFGSIFIVIGAAVMGSAQTEAMFIAGRIIIGTGNNFKTVGCICLLTELCHPRLRHIGSSLYMCTFYIGSSLAAWLCYGLNTWQSDWAWRIPLLFQATGPIILIVGCFFMPESPRWLVSQGRVDEARAVFQRLHANGAKDDELVENELAEVLDAVERERETRTTWGSLFKGAGNRKRMGVIFTIATGTQWNGVGIVSYYLPIVLRSVGITNNRNIAAINGGLAVFNLFASVTAAQFVERLGRRPLWLLSTAGELVCYICITAFAGSFANTGNSSVGLAVVPFLFIYYGFYCMAWTPLSYTYSSEILPFAMRAKGLAIYACTQNASLAFNQWVNPVALAALAWKFYGVYVAVIAVYLIIVYFLFIETKGLTIEETAKLFDMPKGDRLAAAREVQAEAGLNGVHAEKEEGMDKVEDIRMK